MVLAAGFGATQGPHGTYEPLPLNSAAGRPRRLLTLPDLAGP